jgi:hypothetical protein
MLAALLLAAGAAAAPQRTLDQRVNLIEARQMLQSQAVWSLQAAMPPDAAKALSDLDLHLQEDRDRDEKMQQLEETIGLLEQRLQAVELLLGDRSLAESAPVRVQPKPPQVSALVLKVKPQPKAAQQKPQQKQAKAQAKANSSAQNKKPRTAVSAEP